MEHTWTKADQHGWTVCMDCGAIREYPHDPCDPDRKALRLFEKLEGKNDYPNGLQ